MFSPEGGKGEEGDHPQQARAQAEEGGRQLQHLLGHHGEGPVWLQPNQQSLPSLPPGKLPHHVLPWSSHLEQQEGDFFQLSPQKEADFDGKEAEMNPHNNFVFGPETLCWSSF